LVPATGRRSATNGSTYFVDVACQTRVAGFAVRLADPTGFHPVVDRWSRDLLIAGPYRKDQGDQSLTAP
jgi:hypothetical protein